MKNHLVGFVITAIVLHVAMFFFYLHTWFHSDCRWKRKQQQSSLNNIKTRWWWCCCGCSRISVCFFPPGFFVWLCKCLLRELKCTQSIDGIQQNKLVGFGRWNGEMTTILRKGNDEKHDKLVTLIFVKFDCFGPTALIWDAPNFPPDSKWSRRMIFGNFGRKNH